jgi:hypothetical protein
VPHESHKTQQDHAAHAPGPRCVAAGRPSLDMPRAPRRRGPLGVPLIVLAAALVIFSALASSALAAPVWHLESEALPSAFQPTDGPNNDVYRILLQNLGDTPSRGTITIVDHLPPGVTTSEAPVSDPGEDHGVGEESKWNCADGAAGQSTVTCTLPSSVLPATSTYGLATPSNTAAGVHKLLIPVQVGDVTPGEVTNTVTVSGGGAANPQTIAVSNPVDVAAGPTFGLSSFSFAMTGPQGEPFTQALGHPYAVTTDFAFNREIKPGQTKAALTGQYRTDVAGEESKAIVAELPLGLIGDPRATPYCSQRLFSEGAVPGTSSSDNSNGCPADTRVGVVYLEDPGLGGPYQLFNLAPGPGHAAQFGFDFGGIPLVLFADVAHGDRGYVLRVSTLAPQAELGAISLTFFGDPAAAFATGGAETAFLTAPPDCEATELSRTLDLHFDSWTHPGSGDPFDGDFTDPNWISSSVLLAPVQGCGSPHFQPSLALAPGEASEGGTTQADEPSGYDVDLTVPQSESYGELATPELKTATVTLPEGLSASPSAANGLQACSDAQIALQSDEIASCPLASQIGTVKVTTPLLEDPLEGQVFLGAPECSPCSDADAAEGHIFRLFIQIHSDQYGITIKLPGTVRANPATGQLTATFAENPQLPFSDLQLHFTSGPRAPLANPQTCATFTTSSDLLPWSSPETPDEISQSSFSTDGCGAGFGPAFAAGTASPAAGAFSPFSVTFSRQDREQDLGGVAVTTPPGLLGRVAGVARCPEAQANAGSCGAESQIGTTTVSAGPGPNPYTITGGRVYLTGPYEGAPFGLSIVVPAVAGPFNLGDVVVRARIAVNPSTAALTITSDPLPQIKDGVPFRLRTVTVEITRPAFILNATDCTPRSITAAFTGEHPIASGEASRSSAASSPYAPSGCANLPFKPTLTATAAGKASKANGASLVVNLQSSGLGQADIAKVDLQLPKALPSRLSTLQKACTDTVFDANPAACHPESVIGKATIHTPLLDAPLVGPAYLVSHGGAAFPDVEFVLQGEGVVLILDGKTDIKNGITYSRFDATPDAPFTSFETELPAGPHSIFTANVPAKANYGLCAASLAMPTEITAQNGALLKQTTKIAPTGCGAVKGAKAKKLTRAQKLKRALKACKKKRSKAKRAVCQRQARKRFGPIKAKRRSHTDKGASK